MCSLQAHAQAGPVILECVVAAQAARQSGFIYQGVHTVGFNMNDACIQGMEARVGAYLASSQDPGRCVGVVINTYVADSGLEYLCHTGGGKFAIQVAPPADSITSKASASTLQANLGTAVVLDKNNSSVDVWDSPKVLGVTVLQLKDQANQVKLGPSFSDDSWKAYGPIPMEFNLAMPCIPAASPPAGCCPSTRKCCSSCFEYC